MKTFPELHTRPPQVKHLAQINPRSSVQKLPFSTTISNQPISQKYAVLSMDVEDWYHTGYLQQNACDRNYSMLDGLDQFIQILTDQDIPAQLFVLGELLRTYPARFRELHQLGHELASHGWSHQLASKMPLSEFEQEMQLCQWNHQDLLGNPLFGYRAPCFRLNREQLNLLIKLGFQYDSSSIQRCGQRSLNLTDFTPISDHIFRLQRFFEFQLANFSIRKFNFPTAGGGAMRILPWQLTRFALKQQLKHLDLYSLYLHPIDISTQADPPFPRHTHWLHKLRFNQGRLRMADHLKVLISDLKQAGYQFITYGKLSRLLLEDDATARSLTPTNAV